MKVNFPPILSVFLVYGNNLITVKTKQILHSISLHVPLFPRVLTYEAVNKASSNVCCTLDSATLGDEI